MLKITVNPNCKYGEGFLAYGKTTCNPYEYGSNEAFSWQLGFDDARHDRHGDPE
ncbi:hypothetical protein HK44_020405 [Pseudomonas fluorescens HK44]|uniref:Uncharacterized protein n=1 Tax=Pseudomonas fluorescens HK44 TaxID=1042209 RepID=A0A010T031_PSEFL|nr:hypothetical protein [Pseudomonas fluorescens]EXF96273.1 hypothetical protein HK44_020405 [Pseudomonas fluorescens HK44]